MTSSSHQQAARANGALSQGPKTEAGKASSARNALRHGLCASTFVLDDPADDAKFRRLVTDLRMTLQAVDEAQERAVEQMAIAMWRQTTVANMERALLGAIDAGEATAEEGGAGLPSLNSVNRYRARIERDLRGAENLLARLQAARVRAMQAKLEKAKEFSDLNMLAELSADLGVDGLMTLQQDCTNEPNRTFESGPDAPPVPDQEAAQAPVLNRRARRRAEKLAKKDAK